MRIRYLRSDVVSSDLPWSASPTTRNRPSCRGDAANRRSRHRTPAPVRYRRARARRNCERHFSARRRRACRGCRRSCSRVVSNHVFVLHVSLRIDICNIDAYLNEKNCPRSPERPMRLTRYNDYAMRVLLYLGTRPDQLCSVSEIARAYDVPQKHLMTVATELVRP